MLEFDIMDYDALIIVDMQRDFCPGGTLPVYNGYKIVGYLNKCIAKFSLSRNIIIFSRDWHPINHISFIDNGGPWPSHCIQNTKGAEFASNLTVPESSYIINKGINACKEAYSIFENMDIMEILASNNVRRLTLGGLALEYCVKESALDAIKYGFMVRLLCNGTLPIDSRSDSVSQELDYLKSNRIELI